MLKSVNLCLTGPIFLLFLADCLRSQKRGSNENTDSAGVPAYFTGIAVFIWRQGCSGGNRFPHYCPDRFSGKGLRGCLAMLWSCFFAFTVGLKY